MPLINKQLTSRSLHSLIAGVGTTSLVSLGVMLSGQTAKAATASLVLPDSPYQNFYVTTSGSTLGAKSHVEESGGNFFGTLGSTSLTATYCVDFLNPISVSTTYDSTTYTTTGSVFGSNVTNASKISWLMYQYGGSATTVEAENALQAAIWKTEYGSSFELDGADNAKTGNSAGLINTYKYFVASLGNNTLDVSQMYWISPDKSQNNTRYQGLVAMHGVGARAPISAVPEAGSLALLIPVALPFIGMVRRRRS